MITGCPDCPHQGDGNSQAGLQAHINRVPGPTAADRPSVTDNARAEADRRYNSATLHSDLTYPAHALESHRRAAFVAGAEWAAGRAETTTATVEDAARVIDPAAWAAKDDPAAYPGGNDILTAPSLRTAQSLADAGLLARPLPDRDELARALIVAAEGEAGGRAWDVPGPHGRARWYVYADAVLDLLRGGGDDR